MSVLWRFSLGFNLGGGKVVDVPFRGERREVVLSPLERVRQVGGARDVVPLEHRGGCDGRARRVPLSICLGSRIGVYYRRRRTRGMEESP